MLLVRLHYLNNWGNYAQFNQQHLAVVSSSGGGGVSAPSVGSVGGGQEQQQQPLTQRFVNINLSGSDNSMYSKGAVRDLITRINEEVKDGCGLRVL